MSVNRSRLGESEWSTSWSFRFRRTAQHDNSACIPGAQLELWCVSGGNHGIRNYCGRVRRSREGEERSFCHVAVLRLSHGGLFQSLASVWKRHTESSQDLWSELVPKR